ncbi:MAG: 2-isopropylmalate synthase, partial [Treponema sp.]|nr:2-isopropylmalate synthase [Treponema sp.]
MRRLSILDTTLRDGDQAAGFAFSPDQKRTLARALIEAGVDTVETGFPLSSPADFDLCRELAREFPGRTAVMCRGRREDIAATARVFSGGVPGLLHISLPVSKIHIRAKLGITETELLKRTTELSAYAAELVSSVEFGAEDATRADRNFLFDYCGAAFAAGVNIVNIADTLGIAGPGEFGSLIVFLKRSNTTKCMSVHCHNDLGLALANTLAAIEAGCGQVEVSAGGIGERAGNAALEELCLNLEARREWYGVHAGLKLERLPDLIARVREISAIDSPLKPVSGWNIRAHASGIHQQGLARESETYANPALDAISPGPERIILSRHSGQAGLRLFAQRYCGFELSDPIAQEILARVKAAPGPLTGLTEFLCMLVDCGALPAGRKPPLVCRSFSQKDDRHLAGEKGAWHLRAVLAEYCGPEDAEITVSGAGDSHAAAILDALRVVD